MRLRRLALPALAALLLVACGDDDEPEAASGNIATTEAAGEASEPSDTTDTTAAEPEAGGDTLPFELTGAAEVPGPGDDAATGSGELTLDLDGGQLCFTYEAEGLDDAAAAHLHRGGPDVAGDVVVTLQPPVDGTADGCADADVALLEEVAVDPAGFYVNVHTPAFPDGAARGNLG